MKSKLVLVVLFLALVTPNISHAQDPFIGEIKMFAGNFAPRGWAFCEGQLLPISQYTALFSLLGTTYGGDGRTTFALPDLRGRTPIHHGNGPGLSTIRIGQKGGFESNNTLPVYVFVNATKDTRLFNIIGMSGTEGVVDNRAPFLSVSYIIALQGVYPSRN